MCIGRHFFLLLLVLFLKGQRYERCYGDALLGEGFFLARSDGVGLRRGQGCFDPTFGGGWVTLNDAFMPRPVAERSLTAANFGVSGTFVVSYRPCSHPGAVLETIFLAVRSVEGPVRRGQTGYLSSKKPADKISVRWWWWLPGRKAYIWTFEEQQQEVSSVG